MSTKKEFLAHLEALENEAISEAGYKQYPENEAIFPNDQLYMARVNALSGFAETVDQLAARSNCSVAKVLKASIEPNIATVSNAFPFLGERQIKAIIKQFGQE